MRSLSRLPTTAFVALPFLAASLTVAAPPASALSCVGAEGVLGHDGDAPLVYTGHVVEVDDNRIRVATATSWRGSPPEPEVWLNVDMPEWSHWHDLGGDERELDPDQEWVFAPYQNENSAAWSVNPCTSWHAGSEEVAKFEPANPRSVTTPDPDGSSEELATTEVEGVDQMSADVREQAPENDGAVGALVAAGVLGVLVLGGGAVMTARRSRRSGSTT